MKVIGLTGGIASGKTTVSNYLKRLGAMVLDADLVARQVVTPGQPAWYEIKETFGCEVFHADGTLDRAAMGRMVFFDSQVREKLNRIIHPRVTETFRRQIRELGQNGVKAVILDVPLLLETGMERMVDEVWVVAVDEATQLQRVMERDKLDEPAARARISAQMPLKEKLKRSHRVIDANQSMEDMFRQVEALWKEASS